MRPLKVIDDGGRFRKGQDDIEVEIYVESRKLGIDPRDLQNSINGVLERSKSNRVFLRERDDSDDYIWLISSKLLDDEETEFCFDVLLYDDWEDEWPEEVR